MNMQPQSDRRSNLMARLNNRFDFDPDLYANFSKFFVARGDDAGAPDWWLVQQLQSGLGNSINKKQLLEATILYRTHKPKGGQVQLPTYGILNIVAEQERMSFWQALNRVLVESQFYTLIHQLALYNRVKSTVAHMVPAEKSYAPEELQDLHKKFLTAVTSFMRNGTLTIIAQHILEEQEFVLSILEEPSFARKVVDISGGEDPFVLIMELPAMHMWKTSFYATDAITQTLAVLGTYDNSRDYREQMEQFVGPADHLYTAMVNLAEAANLQYGIPFDPTKGLAEVVKVLESTLSRRSGGAKPASAPEQKAGNKFYIEGSLDRTLTRELRLILARLYENKSSIDRLVADAELDKSKIATEDTAENNAHAVLVEAGKENKVGNVITIALLDHPGNSNLKAFLAKLTTSS